MLEIDFDQLKDFADTAISEEAQSTGETLSQIFKAKLDNLCQKILPKDQPKFFGSNFNISHLYIVPEKLAKALLPIFSGYRFRIEIDYAFLVLGALGIRGSHDRQAYAYPFYCLDNGQKVELPDIEIKVPKIQGIPYPQSLYFGETKRLDLRYEQYLPYVVRPKENGPTLTHNTGIDLYLLAAMRLHPDILHLFFKTYPDAFTQDSTQKVYSKSNFGKLITSEYECAAYQRALQNSELKASKVVWPKEASTSQVVEGVLKDLYQATFQNKAMETEETLPPDVFAEGSLDGQGNHFLLPPAGGNQNEDISQATPNYRPPIYEPSIHDSNASSLGTNGSLSTIASLRG